MSRFTKTLTAMAVACAATVTMNSAAKAQHHGYFVDPTACTAPGFGTESTATLSSRNGKNAILLNVFGLNANAAAELDPVLLSAAHGGLQSFQFDTSANFNTVCFDVDPGDGLNMELVGLVSNHTAHGSTSPHFVFLPINANDAVLVTLSNGDTRVLLKSSVLKGFKNVDIQTLWVECDGPQACNRDNPNTYFVYNFVINGTMKPSGFNATPDNSACKFLEL